MALFGKNILRGSSGAVSDYEIERSCRFNRGDDAGLEFSPSSSSDNKKGAFSIWIKSTSLTGNTNGGNILAQGNYAFLQFHNEEIYFGNTVDWIDSAPKCRDPHAWYHICVTWDTTQGTAADRMKIYINNVSYDTSGFNDLPAQNDSFEWCNNSSNTYRLARRSATDQNFEGYLAEIHHVDGTVCTPSDFAETNEDTGAWVPKKYAGAYGTNGFYLNFSDNSGTTSTTLGKDSSGNGNNWTPVNLTTGDSVKDTPTNNFATLRMICTPWESGASLSEGNLKWISGSGTSARNQNKQAISNILVKSGKWYSECRLGTALGFIGVGPYQVNIAPTSNNTRYAYLFGSDGNKYVNTNGSESIATHAASYTTGDILGVYLDMDASPPAAYFSKNGQWADGSGNFDESSPTSAINLDNSFLTTSVGGNSSEGYCGFIYSSSGSANNVNAIVNFGQDSTFAGNETAGGNTDSAGIGDFKYTVPTGAKALCTSNMSEPTILKGSDHFNTILYTGQNTAELYNVTGVGFQPNLVWGKSRNDNIDHILFDSVRGDDRQLSSDSSAVETLRSSAAYRFLSDGFAVSTVGNLNNPVNYVAWNWKESATAGFDIVSYSGNDSADRDISHSLGVIPDLWIVKSRTNAQNWITGFRPLGAGGYLSLETSGAFYSGTGADIPWSDEMPTSAHFTVGENGAGWATNESGEDYIAYLWASVDGFSKIGTFTGNGNSDGTYTYLGFKPSWLLIKRTNDTGGWEIVDNKRNTSNEIDKYIYADLPDTEYSGEALRWDFLANGFKMRTTNAWGNNSGSTYLYMAFAEHSFKYANAR